MNEEKRADKCREPLKTKAHRCEGSGERGSVGRGMPSEQARGFNVETRRGRSDQGSVEFGFRRRVEQVNEMVSCIAFHAVHGHARAFNSRAVAPERVKAVHLRR